MSKVEFKPNTLLYPVPVLLVSSGTEDGRTNIMTAGWTGTVCTKPPMAYVSIRPERVSYGMIRESGEFVLNLNTEALAAAADQCGVVSAAECPDKWALTGLTRGKASHLDYAPIIMESPLNIECRVRDILPLGSHHMFIGEVVGIDCLHGIGLRPGSDRRGKEGVTDIEDHTALAVVRQRPSSGGVGRPGIRAGRDGGRDRRRDRSAGGGDCHGLPRAIAENLG